MLQKIHKSAMSRVSQKRGNPMVAHLTSVGTFREPLCQAAKPKRAYWIAEGDPGYSPDRDCVNCANLARRWGLR